MTPWVKRLIIANVIVFFLEQTVRGLIPLFEFTPRLRPVPTVDDRARTCSCTTPTASRTSSSTCSACTSSGRASRSGSESQPIPHAVPRSAACAARLFVVRVRAESRPVIGASAAVFGVMLAFARFWPDAQILFLFFLPLAGAVRRRCSWRRWRCGADSAARAAAWPTSPTSAVSSAVGSISCTSSARRARRSFASKTVARDREGRAGELQACGPHDRCTTSIAMRSIASSTRSARKGLGSLSAEERLFLSNFVPPDDRVPPPT